MLEWRHWSRADLVFIVRMHMVDWEYRYTRGRGDGARHIHYTGVPIYTYILSSMRYGYGGLEGVVTISTILSIYHDVSVCPCKSNVWDHFLSYKLFHATSILNSKIQMTAAGHWYRNQPKICPPGLIQKVSTRTHAHFHGKK